MNYFLIQDTSIKKIDTVVIAAHNFIHSRADESLLMCGDIDVATKVNNYFKWHAMPDKKLFEYLLKFFSESFMEYYQECYTNNPGLFFNLHHKRDAYASAYASLKKLYQSTGDSDYLNALRRLEFNHLEFYGAMHGDW